MRTWPLSAATLMLASALGLSHWSGRDPESTPAHPIRDLPLVLAGRWQAREIPMTARELELLGLSDYVSRVYMPLPLVATSAPVQLYIGYYQSQRTGATYHSPLNCLPGNGWQITESGFVSLPGASGLRVRRLVMAKELQRALVLYWYQDRGRVITSEYAAKAYLLWDAIRFNRTDGALVRILVPEESGPEAAFAEANSFVADLWPELARRLPKPAGS
jgi:EpsI family protein